MKESIFKFPCCCPVFLHTPDFAIPVSGFSISLGFSQAQAFLSEEEWEIFFICCCFGHSKRWLLNATLVKYSCQFFLWGQILHLFHFFFHTPHINLKCYMKYFQYFNFLLLLLIYHVQFTSVQIYRGSLESYRSGIFRFLSCWSSNTFCFQNR